MTEQTVPRVEYLEVYIATLEEDPGSIKIGSSTISSLVEEANRQFEESGETIRLRTVTDPRFYLMNFKAMDWSTEKRFRDASVSLCVIDGNCFRKHIREIFTIRGHHFPPAEDYPRYCITSPEMTMREGVNGGGTIEDLEREFRCKLVEPSERGFRTFTRILRLMGQISGETLSALFRKR